MAATIAQLRTGHCGLNHYLWRFKKRDGAECENCGYEKEMVEHFLLKCPTCWRERQKLRMVAGIGGMTVAALLGKRRRNRNGGIYLEYKIQKANRLRLYPY